MLKAELTDSYELYNQQNLILYSGEHFYRSGHFYMNISVHFFYLTMYLLSVNNLQTQLGLFSVNRDNEHSK